MLQAIIGAFAAAGVHCRSFCQQKYSEPIDYQAFLQEVDLNALQEQWRYTKTYIHIANRLTRETIMLNAGT